MNYILKLLTEFGINIPFDGLMTNSVYLNWYVNGFWLGLNIVNGNYDVWFTGQKPISYAYGIES